MIGRILAAAVHARWLVLFVSGVVAIFGAWQLTRLPIDVTPDITNKQVQINTVVPTLGPLEIEKRVTYPIETALSGLNGVEPIGLLFPVRVMVLDEDLAAARDALAKMPGV